MISFVATGAGISFLTSGYSVDAASDVVFRPLEDPAPVLEIAIAWHPKRHSVTLANFLEIAKQTKPQFDF